MVRNLFSSLAAIIIFCCIAPGTLEGATFHVASNGFDSIICGGMSTPCRSISQAITIAIDRDRIVVGPGSYGPGVEGVEGPPGCVCMIKVDKSLTLVSRDGAEVTVLDVAGSLINAGRGYQLSTDGSRLYVPHCPGRRIPGPHAHTRYSFGRSCQSRRPACAP